MTAPRVSVLIPTYNRAALVVEAITSVLAQTYRDLEVIVCDDGSDDDTGERVRAFGPPVRYLRLDHTGGWGGPRNRGLLEARGDLVAFLDDDDLWDARKLERQLELLGRRPVLDCVYCDCEVVDDTGTRTRIALAPEPDRHDRLLDRVLAGEFPSNCTLVVRREALERIGRFDEEPLPGLDFTFWLSLARFARVGRVPEPLTLVRQQVVSLSRRAEDLPMRTFIRALEAELMARDLTTAQRLRCRHTLALNYAQLANVLRRGGDLMGARRAALRGVVRFPPSRSAWRAAARAWTN